MLAAEPPVGWFCLDAVSMTDVDYTGGQVLSQLHGSCRDKGVRLVLAQVQPTVLDQLRRYGTIDELGADAVYDTLADVVAAFGQVPKGERRRAAMMGAVEGSDSDTSGVADTDRAEAEDRTTADIGRIRSYVTEARSRAGDAAGRLAAAVEERRSSVPALDVGVRFYERDRNAVGSVLGSAIAFRLFLFFVPLMLFLTGLASLVVDLKAETVSDEVGLSESLSEEIAASLSSGATTSFVAILLGLWGTLWAGRSLAKVLIAVAALSWREERLPRSAPVKVVGAVIGLIGALMIAFAIVNRIRTAAGPAIGTTAIMAASLLYAAAWFFVSLALPRATRDPSALLPGATLVGLTIALLQWFTQFYLPDRISESSAVYGAFGIAVVSLGWFFILGRTLTVATTANAVIFERFGSIAEFVFGLPLVRAVPRKFPSVARFFDLERAGDAASPAGGDDPTPPSSLP
jgi:uncharacterized BrkB/YihY/UPF0761 family membrane protein